MTRVYDVTAAQVADALAEWGRREAADPVQTEAEKAAAYLVSIIEEQETP